jgi:large subunit ribosomal protein L21
VVSSIASRRGHLEVEKLDAGEGESIEFEQVLMVARVMISKSAPLPWMAAVTARVKAMADTVEIIKFKRRKHHMKRMGHRQSYTEVEITGIS